MKLEIDDKSLNDLMRVSIRKLTDRTAWSHHADIRVRKDGQDYWFEADWLKYLRIVEE